MDTNLAETLNFEHENCQKSGIKLTAEQAGAVGELFKTLGEASRLKIVCALMGTEMCVTHLAEQVGMAQSAVSHQLRNLRAAGIVKSQRIGKQIFYGLDDMHVYTLLCTALEHVGHKSGGLV